MITKIKTDSYENWGWGVISLNRDLRHDLLI